MLYPTLTQTIQSLHPESIPPERKALLQPLVHYLEEKRSAGSPIRLVFICTHNSRRSHLAQVWAQALAYFFGIPKVSCYSAGTKVTFLYGATLKALQHAGFQTENLTGSPNPVHAILYGPEQNPIFGFSKDLSHDFNPKSHFAAIMTCTQADGDCPFIAGAERRISLPYEDPKAFDRTAQQAEKYRERSLQIATELCYVFTQLKP